MPVAGTDVSAAVEELWMGRGKRLSLGITTPGGQEAKIVEG